MGLIDKSITYTFFYALPLMLLLLFYVQFYVAIYLKKKARVGVASKISALLLTIILLFSGPLISPIVPIPNNCTVLSWHVITDYKQSKMNAKLLRIWRITDSEKLYYHKLRQKY